MPGVDRRIITTNQRQSRINEMPMETDQGDNDVGAHATHSMEGHLHMGPHMKMTTLRPAKPGDAIRAQEIAGIARRVAEKYTDYHTALAAGYKIFLPNVPEKMYHFTNYPWATEAAFHFNHERPTSLL
jgi:hypothetical protein